MIKLYIDLDYNHRVNCFNELIYFLIWCMQLEYYHYKCNFIIQLSINQLQPLHLDEHKNN